MSILFSFLSLISLFGWFFCMGHLVVTRWKPNWNKLTFIFTVSLALLLIGLGIVTPWFALPNPILFILGLGCVATWFYVKPPLPKIDSTTYSSPFFPFTIFVLSIYFFVIVLLPNHGFDNLSYHIPFIHEFARFGQIPIPLHPMNWVDHVHFIYPKSIEMVFGLANQVWPGSYPLFHFLMVAGIAFLLPDLAQRAGVRKPWIASAIFLSSSFVISTVKHYFVETGILLLYITVLLLLSDRKETSNKILFLFILGIAISMSKITALFLLFGTGLAAYYFFRSYKESVALVGGGLVGGFFVFLPGVFLVSLLKEFSLTQVTSLGQITPIDLRIHLILEGFKRFVLTDIWGITFLVSPIVFLINRKSRPLLGIVFFTLVLFCLTFALTNVFALTYLQVGAYYSFAFIGTLSIALPLFLEKMGDSLRHPLAKIAPFLLIAVLVVGLVGVLTFTQRYVSGEVLDNIFYDDLVSNIPNSSDTKLFFMNNVNPITVGFEKVRITDHTTFPRPTGDPCAFWRENAITHVVYWRVSSSSYQLDGGNPDFYRAAQDELLSGTCTRLLMVPTFSAQPLVGVVMNENN